VTDENSGKDYPLKTRNNSLKKSSTPSIHQQQPMKGKCALRPFLSILVIMCQHKWFKCETMPNGGKSAKSTQRYDSRLSTLVFVY
jgi:hypothetical protein